ncbi:MAG: DUF3416 domain-containing protein [Chelatococcus sp.]|uniref:maltotransferase domain-containing protein n=1 Tax=Chelatococcus sp. TaxID=1953771 RepID=UPI0025C05671|nr:maltotransferase domain-containing protein [Chelatococcus sp.]MBX3539806.1 DUF3416 domain-containing protein [Chelatococcus sp.]
MQKIPMGPCIYYVSPLFFCDEKLHDRLSEVMSLGFTHVCSAPIFTAGDGGNIFLPQTFDKVAAEIAVAGLEDTPTAWLERTARVCHEHKLELIIDIVVGRLARNAFVPEIHDLFSNASDVEIIDPRSLSKRGSRAARWHEAAVENDVISFYAEKLADLYASGASGFRCVEAREVPASAWVGLMGRVRQKAPDCLFIADVAGITPAGITELAGCGFDRLQSSLADWDYRSPELVARDRARQSAAPLMWAVETPFGRRLAAVAGEDHLRAAKRALDVATFAGSGVLVSSGFERAATTPMRAYSRDDSRPISGGLSEALSRAFDAIRKRGLGSNQDTLHCMSGPGAPVTVVLRTDHAAPRAAEEASLLLVNPELGRSAVIRAESLGPLPTTFLQFAAGDIQVPSLETIRLDPGAVLVLPSRPASAVVPARVPDALEVAVKAPRVVVENVAPAVDGGRFSVKQVLGCPITATADLFIDGHDKIAAEILWRPVDETVWHRAPMERGENDCWRGSFVPTRLGRHVYTVEAWRDAYGSWRDEVEKKRAAGQPLDVALAEGLLHLRQTSGGARCPDGEALAAAIKKAESEATVEARIDRLLAPDVAQLAAACDPRDRSSRHDVEIPLVVERQGAAFASWYELFPRSETSDARQHGSLVGVIGRLPAIRAMGFDVLYFPPIHPIGRKNRKGRNNSLTAGPDDPGSPYAIGSDEGGHDAIHPELGTLDDFRRLRDAAAAHGIEIALDFAIQCSPDHPWLTAHPEWFAWRPDGSIRYAENPPKRYEDIVNVDFYADGAIPGLWLALRDIVLTWAAEGVRLFRVDNPHTKPLPFWEWMIDDVTSRYPDVVFLSEAFTKPKMMYRLAKVGFSQSYTYFTWRNDKSGIVDYLSELTRPPVRDFFRPHFFVNTPDINPVFLQNSGRPGFLIRAALATTLSGLWGMYSGFELCEAEPLPGKEEYKDSEKYEIKPRNWQQAGNIIAEITQLNCIRRTNPALQTHLGLTFYNAFDSRVIYYGKATPARDSVILVLINLDPFEQATFSFELPLWEWGLDDQSALAIDDLVNDRSYVREGKLQSLTLDPHHQPYAIWRVRPAGGH